VEQGAEGRAPNQLPVKRSSMGERGLAHPDSWRSDGPGFCGFCLAGSAEERDVEEPETRAEGRRVFRARITM
jgi:hypothetical protein